MTKRRYLKPNIEKALSAITLIIFLFLAMLDDFDLSAIPFLFALMSIEVLNFHVLFKYGRGEWMDHESKENTTNDKKIFINNNE